jgi:ABC-type multidrug transport system fused ATPase/permease subunit
MRHVGRAIAGQRLMFTFAVLGSSLYAAMTVASAYVIGDVTERVALPAFRTGHTYAAALTLAAVAIIGVAVLKILGIIGRRLFAGIMSYRLMADLRRQVTAQYLRLPLSWHQRHPTGQLLSNANSDVESAWFFVSPLPFACGALVMIAITVVALFLTDPLLAVVGLVVFPLVFLTNIVYSQVMSPRMQRAQQLRAEVSEIAHESFDAGLVVKTLGREAEETERFARSAHWLRDTNVRAGRVRAAFDPVLEALPNLGVLAVLAVGVLRVLHGQTDAGDVVTVAYLLTIVAFPIRSLGWLVGEFPRSVVGFDRVQRVLAATGQMEYGARQVAPTAGGGRIDVRHLGYRYASDQPLLEDVTFTVPPGSTTAVVGPTASGKSTLTALLLRLVDPDTGAVLLDGTDLRDLPAGELARHVALVAQQTFLFDDTVRGNVTLGSPATDEAVWEALRTAQADGFVAALPEGLDTRLGERGATLSGGQRQRLALARAVVRRPRLLVLDDATSAVDPDVEARILAAIREIGSTVVVIAYRKATIALADDVVHLAADGRVVDQGRHAELLARDPGYAELVTAYEQEQDPSSVGER